MAQNHWFVKLMNSDLGNPVFPAVSPGARMPRLTFKRPLGFGECTACVIDSQCIVGWWAAERAVYGGVGRGCVKMM